MTTSHIACRHRRRLDLLALSLCVPLLLGNVVSARSDVLVQDAVGDSGEHRGAGRWEAFGVTSPRSSIATDEQGMKISLARGDRASLSRTADLAPAPSTVLCTFNVLLSDVALGRAVSQVFRLGWNFEGSVRDESDATTVARLGLVAAAGAGFQLRDFVGGGTSATFRGTQAITWAVNRSGSPLSYRAPNGTVELIANDRMDVWVGRNRVFDDIATTHSNGRITDLKWYWGEGAGVTRFDHFEIRTLEEATAAEVAASAHEPAVLSTAAAQTSLDGSIPLGRPTPNPFRSTMRFAYAIDGVSAPVDIGVFDIAGRHVRGLARGIQGSGRYEVRWDGLADDGKRVKHGIYFLRASVGSNQRITRIVYVSE